MRETIAKKEVLFIQGAGEKGYDVDAKLAASLRGELGQAYDVRYPKIPADMASGDFGWPKRIGKEISAFKDEVTLVAHSLGASMLLKYLSENKIGKQIAGIFLIATPYWSGEEGWVQGLKLQADFASRLPKDIPIFFYHCRDDEEVSFDHLALYKKNIPWATFRTIREGGHQLNNDLSRVARDMKSLCKIK